MQPTAKEIYAEAEQLRRKTQRMKRVREGLEIPVTEDEVMEAELGLKGVDIPPLPDCLKEPPVHLLPKD